MVNEKNMYVYIYIYTQMYGSNIHRVYNLVWEGDINQNVYLFIAQGALRMVHDNTVENKLIQRIREGLAKEIIFELGSEEGVGVNQTKG